MNLVKKIGITTVAMGLLLFNGVVVALAGLLATINPLLPALVFVPAIFLLGGLLCLLRTDARVGLPEMVAQGNRGQGQQRSVKCLLRSGQLSEDEQGRLRSALERGKDLSPPLKQILQDRVTQCDDIITQTALLAFTSTAVSQSGTLDAISVALLNIRLVRRLVKTTGARFGMMERAQLYGSIFVAALVAEKLEDLNMEELIATLAGAAGLSAGLSFIGLGGIASGLLQGAGNALITLRIGHLAKTMLLSGGKMDVRDHRPAAAKRAICDLPVVLKEGAVSLPRAALNRLTSVFDSSSTAKP